MVSRIIQGGILVALIGVGGMLYSIRKNMMPAMPAAPPVAAAQTAALPAAPVATPAVVPAAPVAAPVEAVPAAPAPRVQPRRTARRPSEPARSYSHESAAQEAAPAPAYTATAPAQPLPQYEPVQPVAVAPPPAPAPPPVQTVTLAAGTAVAIRLLDAVSTERNRAGDTFQATLEEPLMADGVVVADRGAGVTGRVVEAQQSGRVAGLAELALELQTLQTVGGNVQLASDTMIRRADASRGRDAATVGGLAGIGAAIGAIAGGRRGAGIGAAAGGATGAGTVASTRGKPVKYEPETRLTFRLRAPVTVTVQGQRLNGYDSSGEYGRPRLERRY